MSTIAGRETAKEGLERIRAKAKAKAQDARQADMFLEADLDAASSAEHISSLLRRKNIRRPRRVKDTTGDDAGQRQLAFDYTIATDSAGETPVKACRSTAIVVMRTRMCGPLTSRSTSSLCSGGLALRKQQMHRGCARKGGLIPLARSDLAHGFHWVFVANGGQADQDHDVAGG